MNLATGSRITLNETFKMLRELTGYKGRAGLCSGPRRETFATRWPIFELAEELLGYKPVVDFREGLRRTVEWYRKGGSGE